MWSRSLLVIEFDSLFSDVSLVTIDLDLDEVMADANLDEPGCL